MGAVQGQGYIAQALGVADVLAVAYFHAMRYRPDDLHWEERDRFLLSIGHYAIALYAVLDRGRHPARGGNRDAWHRRQPAAHVRHVRVHARHGDHGRLLGHGLGIAVGFGLGLKRKKSNAFVYNLFSDGELGEGSTWEAALRRPTGSSTT